jgi:hypothetical protein
MTPEGPNFEEPKPLDQSSGELVIDPDVLKEKKPDLIEYIIEETEATEKLYALGYKASNILANTPDDGKHYGKTIVVGDYEVSLSGFRGLHGLDRDVYVSKPEDSKKSVKIVYKGDPDYLSLSVDGSYSAEEAKQAATMALEILNKLVNSKS